jgi:hypothetical protein
MIFHTVLSFNFYPISPNVLGIRRFGQVIGQCIALTPAQNVAERKPHKGLKARLGFFGVRSRRTGGEALTVCYVKLGCFMLFIQY